MPSTTPENPRKETEVSDAAMSVIGRPCRNFGTSQLSRRSLTPANMTMASMKPSPPPSERIID